MNDLMKQLDTAFALLSKIPVSGDAVDYMALARQSMRAAYQIAEKLPDTQDKEENDDGR